MIGKYCEQIWNMNHVHEEVSKGYDHRDEFSERIGFHFLHDARPVFLDGANRNS